MRRVLCAVLLALTLTSLPLAPAFGQSAYRWNGQAGIAALAIDPLTPTTLYAGIDGGGLFKSTDGGVRWAAPTLPSESVMALAIDPLTPTTLYAGTGSGVFKSTDGGAHWGRTGLADGLVYQLMIDPIVPTTLYALRRPSVLKSTDGGATWSEVLRVEDYRYDGYDPELGWSGESYTATISVLAIDRFLPTTLYVAVNSERVSWGFLSDTYSAWSNVFKSTDGGAGWATSWLSTAIYALAIVPRVDPLSDTMLYAADQDGGVLKSFDSDRAWTGTGLENIYPYELAIDPVTPSTVYAAGTDLSKTTDGAATWNAASTGLTDTLLAYGISPGITALAIDPMTPGTVYAGTTIGLFKTADGGASWSRTSLAQRSRLRSINLDPTSVVGGSPSTGTATMAVAAPAGGVTVTLSVSGADPTTVSLPGSVTVPAGSTSAKFTVSTSPRYFASATATISGSSDDATRSTTLQISPAPVTTIVSAVKEDGRAVTSEVLAAARTITFTFTGTGNVDVKRFECAFGSGGFSSCTSPVTYVGLTPRNAYDFVVRAIDTSNNIEAQPPSFRLRLGPPEARIDRPTSGPVGTRVLLSGYGLGGVTGAKFNGLSAAMEWDGSLWVVVPAGATTGPITLDWVGGSVDTSMLFTVADTVAYSGPEITVVIPSSVWAGGEITIYGHRLRGVWSPWWEGEVPTVKIGGVVAPVFIGISNSGQLRIAVPMRAVTGRVMVTTSRGSAMSESEVVVLGPPAVTSLLPTAGPVGTEVTVAGSRLDLVTDIRFNGMSAAITSISPTSLTVSVPPGATTGSVTVHWATGSLSAGSFTVTPAIIAIGPNPMFLGTPVTITGTNLMAATGKPTVRVDGVVATLRPGGTADKLQITLPATAVSGRVTVTTVDGSATSATDLVVVRRPTVTSFVPALGPVGAVVTVVGPNLAEVTSVQFNGVATAVTPVSATSLRATVPPGATSGLITLLTQASSVNSLTRFTVTPPSDLQIPAVTTPSTAATGQALSVGTTVRNTGGSPVAASTLRLYLSADQVLDEGDRLLATRALGNVAVGAAVALTTPTTIPTDTAPGTYRIIAAVAVSGTMREADEANNIGVSGPVSITLYRPNLTVTALTPPARGAVGQLITMSNTVRNTGPAPAGPFAVRFHLSSDAVLDSADPVIGLRTLTGLAPGSASTVSTSLRLPATIPEGQYYVIAVADALEQQAELDETNKVTVSSQFTAVPYQPELAITAMTVPARGAIGQAMAVANTVRNTGLATAGPFTVRFHLSSDGVLDGGDPLVGVRSLTGLAAGGASATPTSLRIPATVREGEYYVIAVVDAAGQQAELDETNNAAVSAPFSVVPYRPGDGGGPVECAAARALTWTRPAACPPHDPGIGGDGDD